MIKNVYDKVVSILESNVELKDRQVFLLMCKEVSSDSREVLNRWWSGNLGFTYSSVERAVRKAREENPSLRDSGYNKRKGDIENKVIQDIREITEDERQKRDFHTAKIKQGALL